MIKRIKVKKSDIVLLIIVLIIIVSYIMLKIFTYKSEPILMDYAKNKSINIVSSIINNSINEIISNKDLNIININKNNRGDIVSLDFDNKKVNEILILSTNQILKSVLEMEDVNLDKLNDNYLVYYIPMGVIHDIPALVNIGPKIPFKFNIIGNVNSSTTNNIKEYGINSSLIEVLLNINLDVQVILPFKIEVISVEKNILLDSKIIQGNIPEYYGGLISSSLK